jgi:hypothetical protein
MRGPQGKPRHRREDSIKMDLKDAEFKGVNWIHRAETTIGSSEPGNEPMHSIKQREFIH